MARYRVTLTADAYMAATVEVEAESPEQADKLAVAYALEGNADWHYQGIIDGTIIPNGDTEAC